MMSMMSENVFKHQFIEIKRNKDSPTEDYHGSLDKQYHLDFGNLDKLTIMYLGHQDNYPDTGYTWQAYISIGAYEPNVVIDYENGSLSTRGFHIDFLSDANDMNSWAYWSRWRKVPKIGDVITIQKGEPRFLSDIPCTTRVVTPSFSKEPCTLSSTNDSYVIMHNDWRGSFLSDKFEFVPHLEFNCSLRLLSD